MTKAFLRHLLTNPAIEMAATAPLLMVLCLRELLHAAGDGVGEAWTRRLGWCAVVLLPLFAAVVAGRFAVLSF